MSSSIYYILNLRNLNLETPLTSSDIRFIAVSFRDVFEIFRNLSISSDKILLLTDIRASRMKGQTVKFIKSRLIITVKRRQRNALVAIEEKEILPATRRDRPVQALIIRRCFVRRIRVWE